MHLNIEQARALAGRINAASDDSGPPGRFVAGVATHLVDIEDYEIYAWHADEDGVESWNALLVAEGLLTLVEAQNDHPDWLNHFGTEHGFVRSRTVSCQEVLAVQMTEVARFEQYEGYAWENPSWRVELRDGTRIEPPAARSVTASRALSKVMEAVSRGMAR